MTQFEVAAVYVAANLLILLWLAFGVVSRRRAGKVSLGDGGDENLERAIRVHGNASENIPPALIALVMAALLSAPLWVLHVIGISLTMGRLLHAVGLSRKVIPFRQLGMVLTWSSILFSAAMLILLVLGVL